MPILDLPDLHTPQAGVYLVSVMCAPSETDDYHRQFYQATVNEATVNVLRDNNGKQPLNPAAIDIVARAATGPRLHDIARRQSPALFSQGHLLRGDVAGRLLTIILSYGEHEPGNASKQAAYRMFEKAATVARYPNRSRNTLVKIYDDFESVAHFWTAKGIAAPLWSDWLVSGMHLAQFLGFAESLRQKAEHVRLDRGTALDPRITWKVSDRFTLPMWPIALPRPGALAEAMSHWAKPEHR